MQKKCRCKNEIRKKWAHSPLKEHANSFTRPPPRNAAFWGGEAQNAIPFVFWLLWKS